jgi:hypothetical protein
MIDIGIFTKLLYRFFGATRNEFDIAKTFVIPQIAEKLSSIFQKVLDSIVVDNI